MINEGMFNLYGGWAVIGRLLVGPAEVDTGHSQPLLTDGRLQRTPSSSYCLATYTVITLML